MLQGAIWETIGKLRSGVIILVFYSSGEVPQL